MPGAKKIQHSRNGGMLPFVPPPPAAGDLYHYQKLRAALPRDAALHSVLGPLEHGQFVEEVTRNRPWMSVPMALAIPAYTAGKATGLIRGARSPASWDEIFEAYGGLKRGMLPR
jgi:hypothetical protein